MSDDKFKYLGLTPIKREGGVYSDEPEFQVLIEENYRLNAEIKNLREALKQIHDAVDFPEDTLRRKIRAARTAMGETE